MIQRDFYTEKIIRAMWNGDVKVITGIRRCGKSVLLFDLFYNYLLGQGVMEEQIIRIALDQRRYYKYRNPITLCKYVEKLVPYTEAGSIAKIRENGELISEEYREDGIFIKAYI